MKSAILVYSHQIKLLMSQTQQLSLYPEKSPCKYTKSQDDQLIQQNVDQSFSPGI
jgi:hypothetical protein